LVPQLSFTSYLLYVIFENLFFQMISFLVPFTLFNSLFLLKNFGVAVLNTPSVFLIFKIFLSIAFVLIIYVFLRAKANKDYFSFKQFSQETIEWKNKVGLHNHKVNDSSSFSVNNLLKCWRSAILGTQISAKSSFNNSVFDFNEKVLKLMRRNLTHPHVEILYLNLLSESEFKTSSAELDNLFDLTNHVTANIKLIAREVSSLVAIIDIKEVYIELNIEIIGDLKSDFILDKKFFDELNPLLSKMNAYLKFTNLKRSTSLNFRLKPKSSPIHRTFKKA